MAVDKTLPANVVSAVDPTAPVGAALTAGVNDVGAILQDVVQPAAAQREAALASDIEAEARTAGEVFGAVVQESESAWVGRLLAEQLEEPFKDYDPSFDPTQHMGRILDEYGLENNRETQLQLANAGTLNELHFRASEAADAQERQRILSQHGGMALIGMLDPLTLLTDYATFGTTKALRLGRLATGVAVGAGTVAPLAAADVAGKEVSSLDYLLSAAIGGGIGALLGGSARRVDVSGTPGDISPDVPTWANPSKLASTVNEFTTEVDLLWLNQAAGATERAELLKQLVDDPVRRADLFGAGNAASNQRLMFNEMDGWRKQYDDLLEKTLAEDGFSWLQRKFDRTGRYMDARDNLEAQVAEELIRRDTYWNKYGQSIPGAVHGRVQRLADVYEQMSNRMGEIARDAGLRGFEEFKPRQGYFHRSWNAAAVTSRSRKEVVDLISEAARRGMPGIDNEAARLIGGAIYDRAQARLRNEGIEFFGTLGKTDTEMLRAMLKESGISDARVQSIMGRVEQNLDEAGQVKYAKDRIPLDMTVGIRNADGSTFRMTDMIDTDLGRLADNYVQVMSGRSALAKAGIGGDDASIEAFKRQYADTLKGLPEQARRDQMLALDGLLSDFTGLRPEANILGQGAQRLKSIADATMLSASGLWQVADYATVAHRYGAVRTMSEFLRTFPGVRKVLQDAAKDPDLADELRTVLGVDLARDVRIRPWLRQHDVNLSSQDTAFDRLLHAGKQAVPYLNAMKFVHAHQSRMNANLALNTFARAFKGSAKDLELLRQYGLTDEVWRRVQRSLDKVTYTRGNAKQMNWAAWRREDISDVMDVALRIMDDAVIFSRSGQGIGSRLLGRSAVGQVLGQFRAFVGLAHNKLLRGTLHQGGIGALATLLAFQYPLTSMMVALNEARKGDLDLSEEGLQNILAKGIGYTAGLGLAADAAGIIGLTGGRGGFSVPLTGVLDAAPTAGRGLGGLMTGEFREGTADLVKSATMVVPGVSLLPGTALLIDAIRGD